MGVLDKFLDMVKLSGDDYDDDDFFEDDEFDDEFEEEKPKKGLFKREKSSSYDMDEEEEEFEPKKSGRSSNSKVTPMRQPARRNAPAMEVCVIKPNNMEDSREITETLLGGRTVILNLEGLDLEDAQRIIDFISGATFAIDGNLQKISNSIFLVTPANVDISGDLQDLLGSSLGAPAIQNRY